MRTSMIEFRPPTPGMYNSLHLAALIIIVGAQVNADLEHPVRGDPP